MLTVAHSVKTVSHKHTRIARFFISLCFLGLFAASGGAIAHEVEKDGLVIDHPVVRAPLAGRNMSAGYMTIANKGEDDRLVAAKADFAGKIEIHNHINDNGVMRMRRVDGVDVGHKQVVAFESGGLHLMIFDITETLTVGSYVPIILIFENAGEVEADFVVEAFGHQTKPEHDHASGHDAGHAHQSGGHHH